MSVAYGGHGSSMSAGGASNGNQLDYGRYLSSLAKRFPQSAIRGLFKAEMIPGMISFLAGMPNPATFPVTSLTFTLSADPEGSAAATANGNGPSAAKEEIKVEIKGEDLSLALQYSQTSGLPRLNKWLTTFVSELHNRKVIEPDNEITAAKEGRHPWRLTVGAGSQDLLHKTFNALLDPEDSILVEAPCYAGVIPSMAMIPANIINVDSDAEGVSPASLRSILSQWSTTPSTSGKRFPKALYTVPTGANPAGTTASEQRKRDVLAICREYGILILEDDPYYFLSFQGLGEDPVTRPRSKSYFALESEDRARWGDGYVLRFESFSKVLSAGVRLGFLAGPTAIVNAVDTLTASWSLQPSGPPQALALALLEHWGKSGFLRHVDRVSSFYKARRDVFETKVRCVLGADPASGRPAVAEWVSPVAGMFLWLKLKLPPSTKDGSNEGSAKELVEGRARAKGFLAVPGVGFLPGVKSSPYVRTSFSVVPEDQIEEGFKRLRESIEEAWKEAGLELK
ncbi:PLP-dependent transferase [Tilletiaria anomala UBC 951]|uniref:PLP-dependent transferase n=1 Tax=Tilletiaria anomala (strain ATCC 24038 / CBS 436.72 / UBC 951) TaxID=1037660 RepID=A0A066VXB7_TILAU|nr:PLP-dependent transferase [Tilletiaria anomala UBC 951]KDN46146.1 PLP-dependent transferase [Tilletiaria anomala UBC 951]